MYSKNIITIWHNIQLYVQVRASNVCICGVGFSLIVFDSISLVGYPESTVFSSLLLSLSLFLPFSSIASSLSYHSRCCVLSCVIVVVVVFFFVQCIRSSQHKLAWNFSKLRCSYDTRRNSSLMRYGKRYTHIFFHVWWNIRGMPNFVCEIEYILSYSVFLFIEVKFGDCLWFIWVKWTLCVNDKKTKRKKNIIKFNLFLFVFVPWIKWISQ